MHFHCFYIQGGLFNMIIEETKKLTGDNVIPNKYNLETALVDYKKMVAAGLIKPKGNRIATLEEIYINRIGELRQN